MSVALRFTSTARDLTNMNLIIDDHVTARAPRVCVSSGNILILLNLKSFRPNRGEIFASYLVLNRMSAEY